jgi:hypothetical protein
MTGTNRYFAWKHCVFVAHKWGIQRSLIEMTGQRHSTDVVVAATPVVELIY